MTESSKRYRVCDMGHVHTDAEFWTCPTCEGRLQESDALTALCRKLEAPVEVQTFEVVEYVMKDHPIPFAGPGRVVTGPIEGVLLVLFPEEDFRAMWQSATMTSTAKRTRELIKNAGWEGEVLFTIDTMKLARFRLVKD